MSQSQIRISSYNQHDENLENLQQNIDRDFIKNLKQINQTIINDISVKKGKKQKFLNHLLKTQQIKSQIKEIQNKMKEIQRKNIYQKLSIISYNLAKLGDNQQALFEAIKFIKLSQSNKYLPLRWKMQLAAMNSSSNKHQQSNLLAIQVQNEIQIFFKQIKQNIQQKKPNLFHFLTNLLNVLSLQKRIDIIWIHNSQNTLKYFINSLKSHIKSLQKDQQFNLKPYFSGYDFHIADYMSLQKLQFDFIQKRNQKEDIKQIVKQLVIFSSICCFTRATQKYYLKDYSFKYFHFKAIQIVLLAFDQQCTYLMFLLKVLNDHYGTKMSEISQQNSQIIEINQLKRIIPKQKKQISLKNLIFVDQ